jgi:hypothetical protein
MSTCEKSVGTPYHGNTQQLIKIAPYKPKLGQALSLSLDFSLCRTLNL